MYKKKENKYSFDAYDDMRLSDKDLLIDLKLGSEKAINNLFEANRLNALIFQAESSSPSKHKKNKSDAPRVYS